MRAKNVFPKRVSEVIPTGTSRKPTKCGTYLILGSDVEFFFIAAAHEAELEEALRPSVAEVPRTPTFTPAFTEQPGQPFGRGTRGKGSSNSARRSASLQRQLSRGRTHL